MINTNIHEQEFNEKGVFTERFSKGQEKLILSMFVTNPYADIFFVYDSLSPEQFATLAASYSRTHEPFQKRLLKGIESEDIPLPTLEKIGEGEDHHFDRKRLEETLGFTSSIWGFSSEKNKKFINKWAQEYGHNSIKELANLRFVCENIPDLTGKIITGHPLAHPQVKSSRYIDWKSTLQLSEMNEDILKSKNSELILETLRNLGTTYEVITEKLESFVKKHPTNLAFLDYKNSNLSARESLDQIRKNYDSNSRKSVLDYSRYLLTPAMMTSLGCSVDVRALEEIITGLLSSPLAQDNKTGLILLEESKKIAPTLMGEKSHAQKNQYVVETRRIFDSMLPEIFDFENERKYDITNRTSFMPRIFEVTDAFIAASSAWKYGNASWNQYYKHLVKNQRDVKKIINAVFEKRGPFDALIEALLINTNSFETLMDYGGDRDNHRHRRGAWLRQTLTSEHGFETPELIKLAGVEKQYVDALISADKTFRTILKDDKYAAQLTVPFAYKCRRLISWSPGQEGYYVELRSRRQGHESYREIAFDIAGEMQRNTPLTASHVKVDRAQYPSFLLKDARTWYDSFKRTEASNQL
ncbi:MAG: FAD-dependent thymidylate synthase [Candidatus Nanoarchaeia archaeon]